MRPIGHDDVGTGELMSRYVWLGSINDFFELFFNTIQVGFQ